MLSLSQGCFSFLWSASEQVQKKPLLHGQDSWPKQAKGIFHSTQHHTQYVIWRRLAGRRHSLPRERLDIRTEFWCAKFHNSLMPMKLFKTELIVSPLHHLFFPCSLNNLKEIFCPPLYVSLEHGKVGKKICMG